MSEFREKMTKGLRDVAPHDQFRSRIKKGLGSDTESHGAKKGTAPLRRASGGNIPGKQMGGCMMRPIVKVPGPLSGNPQDLLRSWSKQLKKGGDVEREAHGFGDFIGSIGDIYKNGFGHMVKLAPSLIRTGMALLQEGGEVPQTQKKRKGGKVSREHHFLGDIIKGIGSMLPFEEGGEVPEKSKHRAKGGDVEREAHGFGDTVMGWQDNMADFLHNILPFAEGGDVEQSGQSMQNGGESAQAPRKWSRGRGRCGGADMRWQQPAQARKGGKVSREHHFLGDIIKGIGSMLPFEEGGEVPEKDKRAIGGAGKIRKGVMKAQKRDMGGPIYGQNNTLAPQYQQPTQNPYQGFFPAPQYPQSTQAQTQQPQTAMYNRGGYVERHAFGDAIDDNTGLARLPLVKSPTHFYE